MNLQFLGFYAIFNLGVVGWLYASDEFLQYEKAVKYFGFSQS